MALHLVTSDDLRTFCRQKLEGCEAWLRRLIHDSLSAEFGPNYLADAALSGQPLFRKEIRMRAAARIEAEPKRYPRVVDALLLDDLASVLCKQDAYAKYFSDPFRRGFPAGREHLRSVLNRLVPIRNALSHANPISVHDGERVLCYCDDIVETLVLHYAARGMAQDYDAPSFTRVSDSLGHVFQPNKTQDNVSYVSEALRAGDLLRIEAEVDAHYLPADYRVQWIVFAGSLMRHDGRALQLTLGPVHVQEHLLIQVQVISSKPWHRHGVFDAKIDLSYRVLPPL